MEKETVDGFHLVILHGPIITCQGEQGLTALQCGKSKMKHKVEENWASTVRRPIVQRDDEPVQFNRCAKTIFRIVVREELCIVALVEELPLLV